MTICVLHILCIHENLQMKSITVI